MSIRPIIFDCDPGDDDALALLMAMASHDQLKILGITTSCGNTNIDTTFKNARDICALANREDIKVFRGNEIPLLNKYLYAEVVLGHAEMVHGKEGIGDCVLTPSKSPVENKHAVDFIIETVSTYPEKITLAVTGPMTNVALAMIKSPSILRNIEQIVMMGGARHEKGNITPCAEFNAFVDPHALYKVLESFKNIVMISLDITHQVLITTPILESYRDIKNPVSDALVKMIQPSMEVDVKWFGLTGRAIHDACVTTYLLKPELFSGQRRHVTVEIKSDLTMGQTVVSWHDLHHKNKIANCLFLNQVDQEAVLALIYEKITSYSENREAKKRFS